jgi:hypothetical protein
LILQYSGDAIVSKFELLKANAIGKLKGLFAYKMLYSLLLGLIIQTLTKGKMR